MTASSFANLGKATLRAATKSNTPSDRPVFLLVALAVWIVVSIPPALWLVVGALALATFVCTRSVRHTAIYGMVALPLLIIVAIARIS